MKKKKIFGYVILAILYLAFFWAFPIFMSGNSWFKATLYLHGIFAAATGIAFTLAWAFS